MCGRGEKVHVQAPGEQYALILYIAARSHCNVIPTLHMYSSLNKCLSRERRSIGNVWPPNLTCSVIYMLVCSLPCPKCLCKDYLTTQTNVEL